MLSELNFEFPPAQTFPRQRQSPSSLRPSPHFGDRTIPYAAPSPQPISLLPSSLSPSVPTDPSLRLSPHYVGPIAAFSTPSLASAQRRRPRRHLQKVSTCTVASRRQLPLTLVVSSTDDSCPLTSPSPLPTGLRPEPTRPEQLLPSLSGIPLPLSVGSLMRPHLCGRSRPDPSSFPPPSPASLSLSRPEARRVCTTQPARQQVSPACCEHWFGYSALYLILCF